MRQRLVCQEILHGLIVTKPADPHLYVEADPTWTQIWSEEIPCLEVQQTFLAHCNWIIHSLSANVFFFFFLSGPFGQSEETGKDPRLSFKQNGDHL